MTGVRLLHCASDDGGDHASHHDDNTKTQSGSGRMILPDYRTEPTALADRTRNEADCHEGTVLITAAAKVMSRSQHCEDFGRLQMTNAEDISVTEGPWTDDKAPRLPPLLPAGGTRATSRECADAIPDTADRKHGRFAHSDPRERGAR